MLNNRFGVAIMACWHLGVSECSRTVALLQEMHELRLKPTMVTVSLAIELLDRHGDTPTAAQLFAQWAPVVWAPLAQAIGSPMTASVKLTR
jgi:hypothetical protein